MRDSGPGNKQGEGAFAEEGKELYMDFTERNFQPP